jgi:guanylate kinase
MSHYEEFDYLLINDDFTTTLAELRAIFIANRQRRDAQIIRCKELLKTLLSD